MVLDINKTRSHPLSTDIYYISQVQEIQGFAVNHLPVVIRVLAVGPVWGPYAKWGQK